MKLTERGLVLKQVKLREADQILTLMTPNHGVISASARGSLRPNNKLFSASGLYCYSEWTLHEGKTMYSVDDAMPVEVFFGLRQSIEAVSTASYIAEMLLILSATGQEAARLLRLALNCLHFLSVEATGNGESLMPPELVKAVFELRALAESGYMPDLLACEDCGAYEADAMYFDPNNGSLLCGRCAAAHGLQPNLNLAALAALRHIVLSEDERVFAFALSGHSLDMLRHVAEQFVLFHLDYPPKTLAFLKSLNI